VPISRLDAADPPLPPLIDRDDALDRAAETALDVLVIGGGITGAGIALDAVSRGLRVALVERDDLASGTSSKSSKLIHGGLRYLEQYDFNLVREAARERNRLWRLAPHLVRPLGFVVPVFSRKYQAQLKAGLTLYDTMAPFTNVHRHRALSVAGVLEAVPGLVDGIGLGGFRYFDCQTDDARLTLQIAQAARRLGALIVTHAEVEELLHFGRRVVGARVRDRIGGATVALTSRWTVSATGVWADRIRALSPEREAPLLTPSKGVHLSFSARDLRVNDAALIPSGAHDRRLVFVIPWGDQVTVGTTDEQFAGDLDHPSLDAPEAAYLLHAVNEAFGVRLSLNDAVGAWAGLRPLLSGRREGASSRDLSRRHAIFEEPPGLVTITGGKLTTYRQMAEDLVDRITTADGSKAPCVTARLPLGIRGHVEDALDRTRDVCRRFDIDPSLAGSLLHRHGDEAPAVAAFAAAHGETDRLVDTLPYLRAEVRWAVRRELARTLDDVLQRRMRVSLRHREAGGHAASWAADVLAAELRWSPAERERQLDLYLQRVRTERGVVPLDDDWRSGAVSAAG